MHVLRPASAYLHSLSTPYSLSPSSLSSNTSHADKTFVMAEIAGTIVGIISLSIQLYDKLNEYANGVKDAKEKAEQITAELDRFSDLLEELEAIISNLDPTARVNSTRIGITACADAIDKVKEKLHGKTPSSGSKTPIKLKNLLKRLSFPFRESDINYWKDTLNSIQLHLLTALNALGMYVYIRNTCLLNI